MGYPMTWKRVVHRNGLADGDYGAAPQKHRKRVITNGRQGTAASENETKLVRFDSLAQRCDEYENAFQLLAGDIRRFEVDAVDENGVCNQISRRTGIDHDIVATVLKEFLAL